MAMRTVNPDDAYDKDNFINAMKDISKLEKILVELPKDSWNPELRKGLGELARDDPAYYTGMAPDEVRNDSKSFHSQFNSNIVEYSKKNFKDLLGVLDAQGLALFMENVSSQMALTETGIGYLDDIVKWANEKRKIQRVTDSGNIQSYVDERISKAPEWVQEAYAYGHSDPNYVERAFKAYARDTELSFMNAITKEVEKKDDKTGKLKKVRELDKDKLYNASQAVYEKIKKDKGEDSDEARAYQTLLSKVVYASLKEE